MRARTLGSVVAAALVAAACGRSGVPQRSTTPVAVSASIGATSSSPPSSSERKDRGTASSGVDAVPNQRYLAMWDRPSEAGADFVFDARDPDGSGVAPMLIDGRRTADGQVWIRILLPIRPNGASAWAHLADVKLVPRNEEIVVDLSERILRHYARGELVDRFRVGVGTPATPTGTGTFYVWQRVPFSNPDQPYGIFALGLSGFSPVLSDWPGGGRMAIHGTPYASDRGRAVSHGCVRVYNEDVKHLLDVRLGTPVIIRR